MNKILSFICLTVFGVVLAGPTMLWAENKSPQASVQQLLGEIRQINPEKKLTDQEKIDKEKHSQSALVMLNVAEISKKTLGKYWAQRSDSEQKEFQTLLGELFVHVAFPSSAKFFSDLGLVYGKTTGGKKTMVVPLTVVHESEGEVNIDFHLIQFGDKWQVVDVILDGVSMRNNLRSQFYKVISEKSFNDLVHRMEKKLKAAR